MSKFKFSVVTKNESFKVLIGKGEPGDRMQAHLSDKDAFLLVIAGKIAFRLGDAYRQLGTGDHIQIAAGSIHSFDVLANCELQLILDSKAKISFVEEVG